jgi:hypothetical protein
MNKNSIREYNTFDQRLNFLIGKCAKGWGFQKARPMGSSAARNFQSIGKDRRYLTGWLGVHKAKYSEPGHEVVEKSGARMNGNRTITEEYAGCVAQPLTCDDLSVTYILYDARHRIWNITPVETTITIVTKTT